MYTLGIDVGSSSSKAVILEDGKTITAQRVVEIGTGSSGPEKVLAEVFKEANLTVDDMANIISTGYGRFNVECAKGEISEITCHAKGALFEIPGTTTILDIGGQDVKAIKLNGQGMVMQFAMNDKCAAGTGRFLDVMSRYWKFPCRRWVTGISNQRIPRRSAVPVPCLPNRKLSPFWQRKSPRKILSQVFIDQLPVRPVRLFAV